VLLKGLAADELTFEGKILPLRQSADDFTTGTAAASAAVDMASAFLTTPIGQRKTTSTSSRWRRGRRCARSFERYLATRRKLGKETATLYGVGRHVVEWAIPMRRRSLLRAAPIRAGAPTFSGCSSATARRRASPPTIRRPSTNWRP